MKSSFWPSSAWRLHRAVGVAGVTAVVEDAVGIVSQVIGAGDLVLAVVHGEGVRWQGVDRAERTAGSRVRELALQSEKIDRKVHALG